MAKKKGAVSLVICVILGTGVSGLVGWIASGVLVETLPQWFPAAIAAVIGMVMATTVEGMEDVLLKGAAPAAFIAVFWYALAGHTAAERPMWAWGLGTATGMTAGIGVGGMLGLMFR